jgi:transposase
MLKEEKREKREVETQVIPKAKRRQYSAAYKLEILKEADGCTGRGEIGALLRREGLYGSHLEKWRRQRERGALGGLGAQKRGPKVGRQASEIVRLQREKEELQRRLEQAETIIEVQKKLSELLGMKGVVSNGVN